MNSQRIEKILQKYFEGETSLSEEKELREFFQRDDIPSHLKSLQSQFEYFEKGSELIELGADFDKKVLDSIRDDGKIIKFSFRKRSSIYIMASVAASILILVTVFFQFNTFTRKIDDTFNDPEIAYNEAKKIMVFVSEKFNKGTEQLQPIAKVNDGMDRLQNVAKFDDGLNEAAKFDKYNKLKIIENQSE